MIIQKRSVFVLGLWIPIPGLNPLDISMLHRRPRGLKSQTVCLSRNSRQRLLHLAAFSLTDTTVATSPAGIAHCIQFLRNRLLIVKTFSRVCNSGPEQDFGTCAG